MTSMCSAQRTTTRSGVESASRSVCVLRVGLKAEDFSGAKGSGGSEGGTGPTGGVEESGVSINAHLEEVLEGDD